MTPARGNTNTGPALMGELMACAAEQGDYERLAVLLRAGHDPNTTTFNGKNLLHLFCALGDEKGVAFALGHGVSYAPEGTEPPLITAAAGGHAPCIELLADAGANLEAKDRTECTALAVAATCARPDAVRTLIARGAWVDAPTRNGRSALHHAVSHGKTSCLRALCEAGARTDFTDEHGRTPLHTAAERGYGESCRVLLEHGADPCLPDGDGNTPLQLASGPTSGPNETAELLQAFARQQGLTGHAGRTSPSEDPTGPAL